MISRILAIVVTVLSVAFMGFAFVISVGGPNWASTARSMTEYSFTFAPGPNAQWTATSPDGDSVGSSPVLPSVIVGALDNKITKLQDQLNAKNNREPILQEAQQLLDRQLAADRGALTAGLEQERQRLAALQQQAAQLSNQIVQQTVQGKTVETVVSNRRADVFRLQNQLDVLRADEARIAQIHRQMADLIEQIDGDLNKAQRREQQLRQQLGQ
ncbi:MAG: hypothetical protein KF861_18170 [Planctomycetaceae bacterium]|nr:hypothetical protein [Planctomycetaceae bacterium]